jgi:oligopeptide/dipeptide ABC transporter ATP-binding protein
VLQRPHHPYTRALLDSILNFGDHYSDRSLRVVAGTIPDPHNPEPGCPFAPRCPMATESCRRTIPEPKSEATDHRCLFSGVKESLAASTAAAASDPEELEAGEPK